MFGKKISIKRLDTAHEHFPFLEQMSRHEEFPTINPSFPRRHFPLSFKEEISISFLQISLSAAEWKLVNILHLAFSMKTSYLLWPTCLQGSPLCHGSSTAISDAMEPLAQVLYHGNWLSGKERADVYTSPVQIPVRHAKTLVVSSQT